MDENTTYLNQIMKLWQTLDVLQKTNTPGIYDLLKFIPDFEQTLKIIATTQPDNFDLEVMIIDEEDGNTLFTIPSNRTSQIVFKANHTLLTLESLKQILLHGQKVSDWLISSSKFSIKREKLLPFLNDGIDNSWNLLKQRVGYTPTTLFKVNDHKTYLDQEHIVWCYNSSCTGKTWLSIQLLDKYLGHKFAFNPSSTQLVDVNLLYFLLEYSSDCCLLIDDLQGDEALAIDILKYICSHKRSLINRNIYIVLVSWIGIHEDPNIKALCTRNAIYSFKTDPEQSLFILQARVKNISGNLLPICGNNLCLLSKATILPAQKTSSHHKNYSYSKSEYEALLFKDFVQSADEQQIRLAYICSVLGLYEYETPASFLEQYGILDATTIPAAKFANGTIYIGHKDICSFIVRYIENHYAFDISKKEIIIEYIKSIDGTLKWKALLHIGHNKKSEVYYFGYIWNLLTDLMDSLRKASAVDPTFSNTPSSMCFVLLVANFFREVDDFKNVADAFANCFSIIDGHISIDFEICGTTKDFELIKARMIEEDASDEISAHNYVAGSQLDTVKMHTNWLLSLLIQAGSVMRHFGYVDLVTYAEQDLLENQSSDGSWYPNRVPWITACALRGLSKVEVPSINGKLVKKYNQNNEVISKAITYILNNMNPDGYWVAHTGTWNKIYETSAMCLDALHKFDINCSTHPIARKALDYLEDHAPEWMAAGNEIDGAATACCLMDAKGVKETLSDYLKELTERKITNVFNIPSEKELTEESCKAALIAYYVTELCWNIIERDIDQLMDEFLNDATEIESTSIENSQFSQADTVVNIQQLNINGGNVQFNEGNGTINNS